MTLFSFYRTPQLHFGVGVSGKIAQSASVQGNTALLVTGGKSFDNSPFRKQILSQLEQRGIAFTRVTVGNEPKDNQIDQICEEHRNKKIAVIIAIGGGSVLDAGKAISAMLTVQGNIKDYLEGIATKTHPGTKVPFIAVPTTAGTGSEASANAVITVSGPPEMKRSIRHTSFVPDEAIIDPQLALSCPEEITAACGMDTLTQLIESYVSKAASPITDSLVEKALTMVLPALKQVVKNGDDLEARTVMSYASYISGITLANAGLGAVHGIAPVVGARFPVPHGAACGILLAPVCQATIESLETNENGQLFLKKYSRVAELLTGRPAGGIKERCGTLIEIIEELASEFNIPKLSAYGISFSDLEELADDCSSKNNPVPLSKEQFRSILSSSI